MTAAGRETSGVTTRLIVTYVRERFGDDAVDRVLDLAGERRTVAELEDESGWCSYDAKVALFEAAAVVCDDPLVGRHIGESVLRAQVGLPVRLLLRALGSPGRVFRDVAKAAPKFSTAATMSCVETRRTQAVVTYRLHDGFAPSPFDCDYTHGLLSQVPALFGLTGAVVDHDECQVEGAVQCVYRVRWPRRFRILSLLSRRRVRHLEAELRTLMEQVESLERVASSLVGADLDATLAQIASRAGTAVRASAHVLAVRPLLGGSPTVHGSGLADDERSALTDELLATAGPSPRVGLLVCDVASPQRFYGRLAAVYPGGQSFFPEERRLLAAYAGLAATALDAAASRESSEVLLTLARSLADLVEVDEVCERVVRSLPSLVGSPTAAVVLWHEDDEVIRVAAVQGMGESTDAFRSLEVRPSDTPELLRMIDDPALRTFRSGSDDSFIEGALGAFGLTAVSCVPIVRRGLTLGAIVLGWVGEVPDALDPEVEARLTGLAAQAATAIDNGRLLERTRRQAMHDALTGLPNRLLLEDRLRQAVALASREQTLVGVFLLDLDSFKVVNDTWGHAAGDVVLRVTAERLTSLLRPMDTAARLGGDEFVVVCPSVGGEDEVTRIGERIAEALAAPVEMADGTSAASVSVATGASVGWTIADGDECDVRVLLHAADEAMYRIKRQRSGRQPARNVRR
jgi:diguanylate cyclase (GGDEF)-like protein